MSKSNEPTTTTAKTSKRAKPAHGEPEPEHINYAPAIEAIDDLFTWALDLAMQSVAHWPAAKRRVSNARRNLRSFMRGKAPRGRGVEEDIAFTAALLVRILDADLGLGIGDIATVFDELGLSTEHVPSAAPMRASVGTSVPVATLRHLRAIYEALSPTEADAVHIEAMSMSPAERARWAHGLARLPVPAAAALVRSYLFGPDPQASATRGAPHASGVTPLRRSVAEPHVESAVCTNCPFRAAA